MLSKNRFVMVEVIALMDDKRRAELEARRASVHMPHTTFYDRIVPILFIGLGVVTFLLVILAATVLLGIFPWR